MSKDVLIFSLNNNQVRKFRSIEKNEKKNTTPVLGGVYTFSFTPTSLGVVATVTNNLTKKTIDLTEYEQW